MNRTLFLVFLCAHQGDCRDPKVMVDCHPFGVFYERTAAVEWQQRRCEDWRLPACNHQPSPERLPFYDCDKFVSSFSRTPPGMMDNADGSIN